jgi:developmental checkpoint coupling sporulation initiation to replication initiation
MVNTMFRLSDELLLESYVKAVNLQLDHEFILLVENELSRRGLDCYIKISS